MPEIVEKKLMECTSKSSNKFYEVTLSKEGNTYTVMARWGSRKGTYRNKDLWKTEGGQFMRKYEGDSLPMARREFNKVVRSKTSKGYKEIKAPESKKPVEPKKPKIKTLEEASLERFSDLEF